MTDGAATRTTSGRPAPAFALALGVVLLGLLAYANSLSGAFVFDDLRHVRDNPVIHDLPAFLRDGHGYRAQPGRFVTYLTFALNWRLGGPDPRGFHAVNLLVHLANALLVLAVGRLAFRTPRLRPSALAPQAGAVAFLAAALFATHPMGTQAVTYVVQRLASLAAFFSLSTMALYLAWRLSPPGPGARLRRGTLYGGVLVASLLAFHTKESTFTLPAILALAELLLFEGPAARRLLPLLPVALFSLVIPAAVLLRGSGGGAGSGAAVAAVAAETRADVPVGSLDYLRTQAVVVVEYLRLLAWPSGQTLDHDVAVRRSIADLRVVASAVALAALAGLGAWLAVRARPGREERPVDPAWLLVTLGIGWFFLALAVESSVVPIADPMYEHRAYLPSAGVWLAFATATGLLLRRLAPAAGSRPLVLLGVALGLLLGALALQRNAVWTNEVTLWSDAAAKAPGKFRPHYNLGTALAARGDFAGAADALARAVALSPDDPSARAQLGAALLQSGRPQAAEAQLRAALALRPADPEVLFNLGMLLARTGRGDEARALLGRYLEVAPATQAQARRAAEAFLAR